MLQTSTSATMPYVLVFCRVAISLIFLIAFLSKVRNVRAFQSTVASFNIFPLQASEIAALCFLAAEFATIVLLSIGANFLSIGFALAILLLLAFSLALTLVLLRGIRTSCNCFGPSEKAVSPYDILRNAAFIICASVGLWSITWSSAGHGDLSLTGMALAAVCAVIFVTISMNLREIVQLFR